MRISSSVALAVSAVVLAACGGGADTESLTMDSSLNTCGLSCPAVQPTPKPKPPSNLPPPPTKNTGNNTKLDTTDPNAITTLALEKSIIISDKTKKSLSTLKIDPATKTAVFAIDTKSERNSTWPKPKTMQYYEFGTLYSEPDDGFGPAIFTNGTGLGGRYTEYRALTRSAETGTDIDEELQVWQWDHSYGVQYRDVTGGGPDADHQAWAFGGTKTPVTAMPTGGSVTYTGQFGSTAKTSNWTNTKDQRQTLDYNNLWQVNGTSSTVANFGTNTVTARLTPMKWRSIQTMNGATGPKTIVVDRSTPIITDPSDPDFDPHRLMQYLYSDITLKGTITRDPLQGNAVNGSAEVDKTDGWISNSSKNPFAAKFFGPNANEVTGIFNVESILPSPYGGVYPINNDARGTVQHSGVFHGE